MPQISIIMPVFNAERYLPAAIQSIINQTFHDWELVAVDDGSTDTSLKILQSARETDPRIRIIRAGHLGPSAARNRGIQEATGEFITFLDADDTYFNDTLEGAVTNFRSAEPNLDVLYYGAPMCCDQQMHPDPTMPARLEAAQPYVEFINRHPIAALFDSMIPSQLSSLLIRREFLLETGLFRPEITVGEDFELFLRLFDRGRVKVVVDRFIIHYRSNPDSLMHSPRYIHKRIQGARAVANVINAYQFKEPVFNTRKRYYASKKWIDLINKLLNKKNRRLCILLLKDFFSNKSFSYRGQEKRIVKLAIKLSILTMLQYVPQEVPMLRASWAS